MKANVLRERLFSKDESFGVIVARAVLGLPLVASVTVYLFSPGRFHWMRLSLLVRLRWSGLFLAVFSLAFLFWVHRALGQNFSASIRINRLGRGIPGQ